MGWLLMRRERSNNYYPLRPLFFLRLMLLPFRAGSRHGHLRPILRYAAGPTINKGNLYVVK